MELGQNHLFVKVSNTMYHFYHRNRKRPCAIYNTKVLCIAALPLIPSVFCLINLSDQRSSNSNNHMDNCNAKLLCKLAAPYMYLYCNNGQFFMFFIIKMFIFQKV